MKFKIAFFTSTRGDMGILYPLIKKISVSKDFDYLLFVYGTHTENKYGNTINEIKKNNFKISKIFKTVFKKDNYKDQCLALGNLQSEVGKIFNDFKFDAICILGDRIERIPIINAAIIFRKLVFHLHGGEITEGAIDDQIRHMITKASHLHFTICEDYKKNILKLSEEKFRIHNVGSLAVENILSQEKNVKKAKKKYVILTYHPETIKKKFEWRKNFLIIIKCLKNFNVIITAPGYEKGSYSFISFIKKSIKNKKNFSFEASLGFKKYFKLLKSTFFVIGNSSSGIIEVPYFKIPTINIGERQKGRYMHQSVINVPCSQSAISNAINKTKNVKFLNKIKKSNLYFGDGKTSNKILNILRKHLKKKNNQILLKKFNEFNK